MTSKLNQVLEVGDVVAWPVTRYRSSHMRIGFIVRFENGMVKLWEWDKERIWPSVRHPSSLVKLERLSIPDYVEKRKKTML